MKQTLRTSLGILAGAGLLMAATGQAAQIDVFASSITVGQSNHWSAANTYILKEMVFVPSGTVLVIEAGTVIKGDITATGSQTAIPSLVVSRGGKIYAEGTPTKPIIFTASSDNLALPGDLTLNNRGLWGGVVILGHAPINSPKDSDGQVATPLYDVFEGLAEQENLRYGGSNPNDNSGVFRYVSIRHGGRLIEVGKEINGLTMGGVGDGTVIEFVEVFANEDDGFEFFGGTVNTRYLVAAFCNDDSFDTDQGYSGVNQFWFTIQKPDETRNYGGEYAGDPVSPFNRTPLSAFTVWNATYIGSGVGNFNPNAVSTAFDLKENTAAKHYNSIFTDFGNKAVRLQDSATNRFLAGDIDFRNNLWFGFGNGTAASTSVITDISTGSANQNYVTNFFTDAARKNLIQNPQLKGVSRNADGLLDPRPNTGSPALDGTNVRALPLSSFLVSASYLGAFGDFNWAVDWTAMGAYNHLPARGARLVTPSSALLARGPSSSQDPQIESLMAGVTFHSVFTAGDSVNNKPDGTTPHRFVGKPDGLGAYDNGDGTFTVLANHELSEGEGVARRHGGIGAFVTKLIINKSNLQVLNTSDLITNVYVWTGSAFVEQAATGTNVIFGRFCSADLPKASAFYNSGSGMGTQNRIFMGGEEFSTESRAWATIATGANAGEAWQLPRLGRASWENIVASPFAQDLTIVAGLDDDGTTDSQVYLYIGTKQNTGNDVEKAGLLNGALYGVAVAGLTQENAATTPVQRNFTLANLGDVSGQTFDGLETLGNGLGVTAFMRVEDGHWDPLNPNDFYFLTTGSPTLPSRLWRLRFSNIANPTAGGVMDMMLDGTEGQFMMDNLTVDADGNILITEDPGNQARLARVYKYYPATDGLAALGQSRLSLFLSGQPGFLTQDEEISGIIDVRDILGMGTYLLVNQVHSGAAVNNDVELDEGGQLLLMVTSGSAPLISGQPVSASAAAGGTVVLNVTASAGSSVQWYRNGLPIAGATGSSYTINGVTAAAGGTYYAIIANAAGSQVSGQATITVTEVAMFAGITVIGVPGSQHQIQFATSLNEPVNWQSLTIVTIPGGGAVTYIDPTQATGQPQRFYRTVPVVN